MRTAMDNFTIDDFRLFSHACMYGDGEGWPNKAILIWKADNGDWQLERGAQGSGGHAEMNMLDELKGKKIKKLTMFVSYSPCSECCTELIEYNRIMSEVEEGVSGEEDSSEEEGAGLTIDIYFSCFYKVYSSGNEKHRENWSELRNLYGAQGIELDLLTNDQPSTWESFLEAIRGRNNEEYRAEIESADRRRREDVDREIMNRLRSGGNMINFL